MKLIVHGIPLPQGSKTRYVIKGGCQALAQG